MYALFEWEGHDSEISDLIGVGVNIERLKDAAQARRKDPITWGENMLRQPCGDNGTEFPRWGYFIEEVEEIV